MAPPGVDTGNPGPAAAWNDFLTEIGMVYGEHSFYLPFSLTFLWGGGDFINTMDAPSPTNLP